MLGQNIARTIVGMPTGTGVSRFEKLLLRDKPMIKATLESILEWDWQRLSMAHGEIIESNGKEALKVAHHLKA
jgi:hypothetical protein